MSGCVSNRSDQRSASGRLLSGWLAEVSGLQLVKAELSHAKASQVLALTIVLLIHQAPNRMQRQAAVLAIGSDWVKE